MKTIRTRTIGQHTIFDKFDQLPIDPESTRLANREALAALDENGPVQAKIQEKRNFHMKSQKALGKARSAEYHINNKDAYLSSAKTEAERSQIIVQHEQFKVVKEAEQKNFQDFRTQCTACDVTLTELNATLQKAKQKRVAENPVFAHPRKNELILTDEQFQELFQAVGSKQANEQILVGSNLVDHVIDSEGTTVKIAEFSGQHSIIEDFIGKQYFFHDGNQWIESEVITDLGVTKNTVVVDSFQDQAIEKADLTPEQSEEIRIQGLDVEQKDAEKLAAIDSAAEQAAMMKNKLEIQEGATATAAKTAATTWYNEQVAAIETKYA
jgi:hypothetical protein